MRVLTALVAVSAFFLTGCGDGESGQTASPTTATSRSASTPSPSTTAAATTTSARFALLLEICTERMAEPDKLVYNAAEAARGGTRSVSEIADAFRQAQDLVGNLADTASAGGLPQLADALESYADTLGRARVSGTAGVSDIADAREAVDTTCISSTATA